MSLQLTRVVKWLVILSVAGFLFQLFGDTFFGTHILESFGLVPYKFFRGAFWQLFTYGFMHSDLFHILFNMLILVMIGSELEAQWGSRFFLIYFSVCTVSAALFYLLVQLLFMGTPTSLIPMVGSSGGVYGLLVAYGIIYSERTMLFMMVFPMRARHFVMILAAIEFISTVFYSRSGVANAAHLGGMIVGFLFLLTNAYIKVRRRQAKKGGQAKPKGLKARAVSHLKLVVNNELFEEFDKDERDDGPTFH